MKPWLIAAAFVLPGGSVLYLAITIGQWLRTQRRADRSVDAAI